MSFEYALALTMDSRHVFVVFVGQRVFCKMYTNSKNELISLTVASVGCKPPA